MSNIVAVNPNPSGANAVQSVTFASTVVLDAYVAGLYDIILTGNLTLGTPVNPQDGQIIRLRLIQDATGSRTLTLNSSWVLPTTISSTTLSTAAGTCDQLTANYRRFNQKWNVTSLLLGY